MMTFQPAVEGQEFSWRKERRHFAQYVRAAIEQHRRKADSVTAQRAPRFEVGFTSANNNGRHARNSYRFVKANNKVTARGLQITNLSRHPRRQFRAAGSKAHHNRFLPPHSETFTRLRRNAAHKGSRAIKRQTGVNP